MANPTSKSLPPSAPLRSRKSAWGRAGLIVLVAMWMFVLGVMVGRGTAPVHFELDELQKQLAGLKERFSAEEGQRFKVNLEKLNFFKNLKEAERGGNGSDGDLSVSKRPVEKVAAPIAHKTTLAKKPTEPAGVEPAGVPQAPAAGSSAAPSAAAADPADGELVIQVASSKDTQATQYLVNRLKKKGYPAFSALKEVPDKGVWHRIRVGPFPDRKTAEEVLARLKADDLNAYIVRP